LIAQAQDVQQNAQALQGIGLLVVRNARWINAEGALALQAPITAHGDPRVTRVADRFITIPLVRFEMSVVTSLLRVIRGG